MSANLAFRIGFASDIHNLIFIPGEITLAGIKLTTPFQVDAISDGDIVLHVISEAIIGALGQGDLGEHFPPAKWKNQKLSSSSILKYALDLMKKANYQINNLDVSIILDKFILINYRKQMLDALKTITNLHSNQINLKFNTSEGQHLDFIQAYCVIIICQ